MKASIKNQQATIDGQLYEAPGIEDGECEYELQWQYFAYMTCEWFNNTPNEKGKWNKTRQILVPKKGEETVEQAAERYEVLSTPYKEGYFAFIRGANWQSSQQSKRIAELEVVLKRIANITALTISNDGTNLGDVIKWAQKALKGEGK